MGDGSVMCRCNFNFITRIFLLFLVLGVFAVSVSATIGFNAPSNNSYSSIVLNDIFNMSSTKNLTTANMSLYGFASQTGVTSACSVPGWSSSYVGWSYRKMINLSSSVTVNNHPYLLIFSTSGLTKSKLRADCGDLRFADTNGNPIRYLYYTGCNTTSTKVYLKLNLTSATIPIYVYYGNSAATSASSSAVFPPGIIRFYPLMGTTGDLIGGYTLSVASGTPAASTGRRGLSSESYSFAGSDWFTAASTGLPTGSSSRTTCTWLSYTGTPNNGNYNGIYGYGTQTSNADWSFAKDKNSPYKLFLNIYGIGYQTTVVSSTWKLACGSWNGVSIVAWESGTYYQNATGTTPNTASTVLYVGANSGSTQYMVGKLEEAYVFNTALSSAQMNSLYTTSEPTVAATGSEWSYNKGFFPMTVKNTGSGANSYAYKKFNITECVWKYSYTARSVDTVTARTKNGTFTIDLTKPVVAYNLPTSLNLTFFNKTSLTMNISTTEANFLNATTSIYTGGALVSKRVSYGKNYTANFTGLSGGAVYTVNTTVYDLANNKGYQKSRIYTIDLVKPDILFANPTKSSGIDGVSAIINITFNDLSVSYVNFTWKNATKSKNLTFDMNNLMLALNFDNYSTTNISNYYWGGKGVGGLWHFEETSGNRLDSSLNANTCTVTGNVSYTSGKFGNAAYFSANSGGTADYLSCTTGASLTNLKRTGTLVLWVKPKFNQKSTIYPFYAGCMGAASGFYYSGYGIYKNGNNFEAYIFNGTSGISNVIDISGAGNTTQAMLVAMTWDGSRFIAYRNGELMSNISQTTNAHTSACTFYIGGNNKYTNASLSGFVDEVYTNILPLSVREIKAMYQQTKYYGFGVKNSNMTAYLITGAQSAKQGVHNTGFNASGDMLQYMMMPWDNSYSSPSGLVCTWMKRGTSISATNWVWWVSDTGSTGSYLGGYDTAAGRIYVQQVNNSATIVQVFTGTNKITDTKQHQVCWGSSGSAYKIFIDGVSQSLNVSVGSNNGNWLHNVWSPDVVTLFGYRYQTYGQSGGNRSYDDVFWFNKSVSDDSVAALYNVTFGENSDGNIFTVYKNNLKTATNYTYNALVKDNAGNVNSTETRWLKASQPVYVTFKKKTPADIDTTNLYGANMNLSVTYNMTSLDGINKSTATLEYKTNNTKYDGLIIYNGTRKNTTSTLGIVVKNVSSNFTFTATAISVYPGEYPIDPTLFYLTQPKFQNFTSNSSGYKVKFRFMRNDTSYNSFEFMARNLTNYGIMHIIYCNKSYDTGQNFTTTSNCAQAGQIAAVDVYNHSLSQYDKQYLISIVINVTSGKIRTVQVTNTSYFIFETPTGVWSMASVPWMGRQDTIQYTDNEGLIWINKSLSINADIRQYTGQESFWYRGCVSNNVGGRDCSSWGQDLLQLNGLPPGVFEILDPKGRWSRFVNISHTAALSPNNYAMANYTYSLVNSTFSQMAFIWYNKLNRTYEWNASGYNGTYQVKVTACDVQNECSSIYSLPFFLYNNSKSPVVHIMSPSSGLTTGSASVSLSCNATDEFNLKILGLKIMNGSSVLFRSNRTFNDPYESMLSSSQVWDYNFTKTGVYSWYCFASDGRFVSNASEGIYSINVDLTPPGMSYVYPTSSNVTYSNKSVVVNVTVNENVSRCILAWSGDSSIANWFNTSFQFRQKIHILPNITLPVGYQLKLQLSNLNVGTNFNWSRECNDIRFANNSMTELSYWIESCNSNAHTAVVWINIPYSISSEKYIYMYFGNNDVINASNVTATFDSIWYTGWTQYSSDSCSGSSGWGNLSYDDSSWYAIPDVRADYWDQGGAWDGDDYIRKRIIVTSPGVSYLDVLSNDGQWVYVNGQQISHDGGNCHQNGAVQANTTITSYLNKGENLLAVHCSNGMPGEYCQLTEYQVPNSYSYKYVSIDPTYTLDDNVYAGVDMMNYMNNDTYTYAEGVISTNDASTKYNVTCFDSVSNKNVTKNMVLIIDTIAPVLSYSNPSILDGVKTNNPFLYANVSMSDVNSNYTFVNFYKDGVGLFNSSSGYAKKYVNLTSLTSGYYHVNATGFDLAGNIGRLYTRNYTVDIDAPIVNSVYPNNNTVSGTSISLTCNYSDNMALSYVGVKLWYSNGTLIVDDVKNASGLSVVSIWNSSAISTVSKYWMCYASDGVVITKTKNFTLLQGNVSALKISINFTMPISGCSINNGCRTADCFVCTYAAFNATKFQQYNVTPYGQTETLPFYNITNNGTATINVTVALNQTAVSGFKLKMSTTKAGNLKRICGVISSPSDDCMYVMNTSQHVLAVNVAPGSHVQGWLLTDVVGVSGGTKVERNISISAVIYAS